MKDKEKPAVRCTECGTDCGSKFALKRHKSVAHGAIPFNYTPLAYDPRGRY